MLPVIFKDSAVEDIQNAYNYLEEQEKSLGEKLLLKITEYVEVIEIIHTSSEFNTGKYGKLG